MKEVIKKHKKITLTTISTIMAAIILFLTLVEKTEALISRVASRNPAYEITKYSPDRPFIRGQEPSQIQAEKR